MDPAAQSAPDQRPPQGSGWLPANIDDPRFNRDPEPEPLHPWHTNADDDLASWLPATVPWSLEETWGLAGRCAAALVHGFARLVGGCGP